MATFYLDLENGNDATTATPLGWWSVSVTVTGGSAPAADATMTGGTSGATAKVTVQPGAWAGAVVVYFYGKSGTFVAENVSFTGGATGSIGADLTYCAWKTLTSGATAARIAPGDIIRIAKSPAPSSIGNGTWTSTTVATGGFPSTVSITSSTNASPIVITRASHGYSNGDIIQVVGHTTNTAANGIWKVANVTANTLELGGSTGNGIGGATGTMQLVTSKVVQLASAQTATITRCEANWTAIAGGDCTPTLVAVSTDAKEGGNSVRLTLDAAVQVSVGQAYFATGTLDLSTYQKITFWIKNSAAIVANNYQVKLCSDAAGATPVDSFDIPAIPSTNQWVPITITKTGGGNLGNAIASIAIYTSTVAPTNSSNILIDNFCACATSGLNLQSLISKVSTEQGGYSEGWYPIQSISQDGKYIALDWTTQTKSNAGVGYSSTTTAETVTTYIRETIKVPMVASGTNNTIQDSGTLGSQIEFQGGYNTDTNAQDGESFADSLNGVGSFSSASKNFVTINHLSAIRANTGFNITGTILGNVFTNIFSIGHFNLAITIDSCKGGTFSNICCCNNANRFGLGGSTNSAVLYNVFTDIYCKNNGNGGFSISSASADNLVMTCVGLNNGGYGINIAGYNNKFFDVTTKYNAANGISNALGYNYVFRSTISESTDISPSTGTYDNALLYSGRHNGTAYDKIVGDGITITTAANDRAGGSGTKYSFAVTSTRTVNYPAQIVLARFAVNSGSAVTFKCYVKKDHATNAVAQLILKGGQLTGLSTSDVTVTKANDTNWEELTLNCGTPTQAGVIEVLGSVYYSASNSTIDFADCTITQA